MGYWSGSHCGAASFRRLHDTGLGVLGTVRPCGDDRVPGAVRLPRAPARIDAAGCALAWPPRTTGWLALAAAVLHVLLALVTDHTVIDYLKLTSPLYQLAGIAALVVLLVLTVTSVASLRRRLWRSHRNFQATHIVLGCLLAALLGAHVVTTGRYTGGYGRRIVFVAVAAGASRCS